MDYWEWMTAIMVVLVLANLIRMNMWLTVMGKQIEVLYKDYQDQLQFKENFADAVKKSMLAQHESAMSKSNSQEIEEWDNQ
jgi:hypothetical protein